MPRRNSKRAELLELVDYLLAHDDYSGLGQILDEYNGMGMAYAKWTPEAVRAVFAAFAKHAPAAVITGMIGGAERMKSTFTERERVEQAAKSLGVDADELDDFVMQRRQAAASPKLKVVTGGAA